MMLEEFEKLTGIYPPIDLYDEIEKAYMEYGADKQTFCESFKTNKDGLAEKIQAKVNKTHYADADEAAKRTTELVKKIAFLEYELNREQGWKPYESKNNVMQADYEELAENIPCGAAHYMTDEEAIEWVVQETGFAQNRITIIHEVATEEISRSNHIRKTGKMLDRRPIYCATDYHYIRFDVQANVTNYYEMWNDHLRPFWD